jgi:hypothetical protein
VVCRIGAEVDVDDVVVSDVRLVRIDWLNVDRAKQCGRADASIDCRAVGVDDCSRIDPGDDSIVL